MTAFASSTELAGTVGLEQAMAIAGRAEIMAGNTGKGRHLLAEAVRSGPGGAPSVYASGVALVTDVQLGRPERVVAGHSSEPSEFRRSCAWMPGE